MLASWLTVPLSLAITLVLTPFYLRTVGQTVYGAWLTSGYLLMVLGVVDIGLGEAVARQIAAHAGAGSGSVVQALARTATGWGLASAGGILLVGLPAVMLYPMQRFPGLQPALVLAVLGVSLQVLKNVIGAIPLGLERGDRVGFVTATGSLMGAATGASIVYLFGAVGLGGQLLATGVVALAGMVAITRYQERSAPIAQWWRPLMRRQEWAVVRPFVQSKVASKLAMLLILQIDRVILAYSGGAKVVPPFALTRRPIDMALQVLNTASNAIMPHLTSAAATGDLTQRADLARRAWQPIAALSLAAATVAFWATPPFVALWVGSDQFAGRLVVGLLAGHLALSGMTSSHLSILWAVGEVKWIPWVALAEGLCYVACSALAVKAFGYVAIAASALAAHVVFGFGCTALLVRRTTGVRPLAMLWGLVLRASLANLLIGTVVGLWQPKTQGWGSWLALLALCGLVSGLALGDRFLPILRAIRARRKRSGH